MRRFTYQLCDDVSAGIYCEDVLLKVQKGAKMCEKLDSKILP